MTNLTTDYLDKALTKQTKELKGYVDKKNGTLELNLKKEIEELALMTARGFAAQGKEIQELTKSVLALADTVTKLSKTVDDLAAMTARQFAKHDNVVERLDKLEREFAEMRHSMRA